MGVELSKNYVTRINLKTGWYPGHIVDRKELIKHCLTNKDQQYVAIGWSDRYKEGTDFSSYQDFHNAVKYDKERTGKLNAAFGIFWDTVENDLFWTRDLDGFYWICRAKGPAEAGWNVYSYPLDIGAVIPVEAYKYDIDVPGQIKASFNRPNAGIVQRIRDDKMVEYSKYIYNQCSGMDFYEIHKFENKDFLGNLPEFELEELVISYLQIVKDYYLLSNSIAKKSTTIKIEGILLPRSKDGQKAVVQVKADKADTLYESSFEKFLQQGYLVYLYCPELEEDLNDKRIIRISKEELLQFVEDNEELLPDSITRWKYLFGK